MSLLRNYIASLARPFRRRRFTTARPAFEETRALKPCVFARCRVCGWNVRFGISTISIAFYRLFCKVLSGFPLLHSVFPLSLQRYFYVVENSTSISLFSHLLAYACGKLPNFDIVITRHERGNIMNSHAVWQSVLGEIEVSIPSSSFSAWFTQTELEIDSEKEATIIAPNIFVKAQLEKKFASEIITGLKKNGLPVENVHFAIKTGKRSPRVTREIVKNKSDQVEELLISHDKKANPGNLNPKYTFDNFIVGSSNDLAHAACQAVASNPGTKYNPLYLYGGAGLGKTHLMQAVGNEILRRQSSARVLYTTIETFYKDYLESVRFKKQGYADKYRNVDVLIVDDMQFIAGKEKSQEEFFHTFNELHQNNKQIIISSDKPPKSIPTLTDRLRSRFEWGMAIDIQMPDYETRCAIINAKAAISGITLTPDVVEYLATNFKTNIRELEGALNQLLAYSEMQAITPDAEIAEGLLGNIKRVRPHHITAKQIIEKTARHFGVDAKDMCSAKRDKYIMQPRQIAMYLLRSELKMSFPKIAQELGRKDHTTAMHSIDKITKESMVNVIVREQINDVREKLYG